MKDPLKLYAALRQSLTTEKAKLEGRLHAINQALGGTLTAVPAKPTKSKMSAAGRARIAAAQRARWAKIKAAKSPKSAKPARKKISAAGIARIRAAQKARWAKIKADKKQGK
jgi:hypothetical protein